MKKFKDVNEYIESAPREVQGKLRELRKTILSIVPDATEKISYAMPYFDYNGRFSYFAYFKNHISLFVMNGVLDDFAGEVEKYRTGKATLRFPLDKALPIALIKKLLKATKQKSEK